MKRVRNEYGGWTYLDLKTHNTSPTAQQEAAREEEIRREAIESVNKEVKPST